jgi:histidinol-phosphate aminotransferase
MDYRSPLDKIKDYVPGKSMQEVMQARGLSSVVKMASNENPLGPSPKAQQAIAKALQELHLYPRGDAPELTASYAQYAKIDPSKIIFGNGSDELIWLLCSVFLNPGEEVLTFTPTFSVYKMATLLLDGVYRDIALNPDWHMDLNALLEQLEPNTRMVFLCSPNNPTGKWLTKNEILEFRNALPKHIALVVDQAYGDFVQEDSYHGLDQHVEDGIILLRTFSKLFGLAAVRLGVCIAPAEIIRLLYRVKMPFNVNIPAQVAGVAALADEAHLKQTLALTAQGKVFFEDLCRELSLQFIAGGANFIAVRLGNTAIQAVEWLESKGFIIRSLKSFGMEEWVRITYGLPEHNIALAGLLREWRS